MLQIRLLGQFDVRLDGKRIVISSRSGQSLFAYLAMTAGTPHRREKLAGALWPDTSDENARKNLRQELWRIRKAIPSQSLPAVDDYLLADEFTLTFNRDADYWLDVSMLEKPDLDIQSLTTGLSLYQGELLPGFYDDWTVLERERLQTLFESKMEQLVEKLVDVERWIAVQEQCERWLALGHVPEPAYRALMLSHNARGDMAKVSSTYQRCVEDLQEHFGVEPSAETHALFNGLLKGAKIPRRIMPPQPSGTVTFLFTDIQGSTRLLDKLGDQYATSLAEHHRILRAAIQKWNGTEMDTQGDAFFVTFARAMDAVQCAAEVQRLFASHAWPLDEPVHVRMGLHTGEPLIASTGYVGMDVHRAARIGDAGHGRQVLLSQTTRELVIHELPHGLTIRDLGEHRLKDMKYPTPIYQLVIEGLQADFPPLKTKFTDTEAPLPGEPPFKGLQYFEEEDSQLFFGRELLTARLVKRLHDTQFLSVIIGASGSGKSSLVRAGLIPALKKSETLIDGTKPPEGSANWQIHVMTPTAHPLEALATEFTRHSESVTATATLLDDLARDPRNLSLYLARKHPKEHTLLVIDQFEELFTLCHNEFDREAFIDNLLLAISSVGDRITLVITLRADFYAHLAHYPELRDTVAKQQEYIGPMTAEELRLAIEEPAKHAHWEFEPGLVDLILRDVGDEPGALPLLSHALLETWKRRAGHTLTLKGYADAGGVHGAIAHTAENVYRDLSSDEQTIARDIFLRLTELGEGTEDTRRRASFEELMSHTENTDEVRKVLNRLADARLITLGENTAEVAHEALIREWPTLREWLNQDREGLRLHRHLTEATYEWELLERDPGALYRGAHLAQAREWATLHPNALNAGEQLFLRSSVDQEQREEQEHEEARQRELAAAKELAETQRQSASRLRARNRIISTVGSIALILALLAGMFGVQSNRNAAQAEANFNRAEAQRLALEANRLLLAGGSSEQIALLSLRSLNTHYTPEGDAALTAAADLDYPLKLFMHPKFVNCVAFSPDGKYLLTGSDDNLARLWNIATGQQIQEFVGHDDIVIGVAFSPDGKYAVTSSQDNTARLWDVATGQEMLQMLGEAAFTSVRFSPDGKYILTGEWEKDRASLWDSVTGKEVRQFMGHTAGVSSIAFSPDGKYIVTGSWDNTARLWDAENGREIRRFSGHTSWVLDAAFSPNGKYVITGSADATARLWDVQSGQEIHNYPVQTAAIFNVVFSSDGKYLFTASFDNTTRVWDVEGEQELRQYTGIPLLNGIAVSPDSRLAATVGGDGIARLWNIKPSPELPSLNSGDGVASVAFSPDQKFIFTGGLGGTAKLWDADTGQRLRDFIGHTDTINFGASFSPDGKYILTGSWDYTVRLWDVRTGEQVGQTIVDIDTVDSLAFSPDGKQFVTAGRSGARVWDAETGQQILQLNKDDFFIRVAFSTDGQYIATASARYGGAKIWDASTGEMLHNFTAGVMNSVAFSPDGKYLLTDGDDNIARLWDIQTGEEVRQFIGHSDLIYTATFSLDGKFVATASVDNTARLWDAETGQEIRRFIGHAATVENVVFSPDGKYILTGSDDGTARLWDVDYHTTMNYLCTHLLRDFTEEERAQYGIADNAPTCRAGS